jgi:hypothetical protein
MVPRRWRPRILALVTGTVASLFAAEGLLWILHFAVSPEPRAAALAPRPGERRILCVGDSHTFGIHLDASASYPGRLQSYLDRAEGQAWRVVNLGYPGQNTAQIRSRLAENIAAYRPEIVCLWAGVNNSWSPAMRHLWEQPDGESTATTLESFVQQVRLFKLARMLFAARDRAPLQPRVRKRRPGQGDVPGLDGAQRGEGLGEVERIESRKERKSFSAEEIRRHTEIDLARILATCRAHGVKLVIADYPHDAPPSGTVNPVLDRFAESNALPLVPLNARIVPLVEELGGTRMMLRDGHATALCNFEIARCFLETMMATGLVESRPEWTDLPSVTLIAAEPHVAVLDRTESTARIEVLYEPRWRCALTVEGPVIVPATTELDRTGSALVEVELPPGHPGANWRVRAVLTPPPGTASGTRSSRPIALPPARPSAAGSPGHPAGR